MRRIHYVTLRRMVLSKNPERIHCRHDPGSAGARSLPIEFHPREAIKDTTVLIIELRAQLSPPSVSRLSFDQAPAFAETAGRATTIEGLEHQNLSKPRLHHEVDTTTCSEVPR